jgi:hypothetical protein
VLYNEFRVTRQEQLASAVESAVGKDALEELEAPQIVALRQAESRATGKDAPRAADILGAFVAEHREEEDKRWQQETLLRLVSRLVAGNRSDDALALVSRIQDVQTREIAYELAGSELTTNGKLKLVFDHAVASDMIPPDKVAFLRGFIGRLPAE